MTTKYEKCKKKVINNILKSYEKDNKKVKRRQALAIALSISEKKCKDKLGIDDIKKMENKVNKMIFNNKIQQTNINNAIYLIKHYKSKKKYSKAIRLENKIMRLILLNYDNIKSYIIKDFIKFIKN